MGNVGTQNIGIGIMLVYFSPFTGKVNDRVGILIQGDFEIRADRDYEIVDQEATEKLTNEKLEGVLPVFDWEDAAPFSRKIVENKEVLNPWLKKGVLVRRLSEPGGEPSFFKAWDHVISLEEAIKRYGIKKELHPTFIFNPQETEARKQKVLQEIKAVVIKVQRGESIIRLGDRIEPWHVKVIDGIQTERSRTQLKARWVGTFGLTFLMVSLLQLVGLAITGGRLPGRRDLLFQGLLLLMFLGGARLFLFFSAGIRDLLPFGVPLSAFYVALPIAAAPMIVRLVLSAEKALIFAFLMSILSALLLENRFMYGLYFLVGGITAVWLAGHVRSRAALLKSGLQIGLLNVVSLVTLQLANASTPNTFFVVDDLPLLIAFAGLGGALSGVVVMILMPLFETVFNYLTPIKLLEFGSLNHPVLREMIVRAPGTYHHSHMVGTLAEAACEGIGADGLFARVASYFHDIGKLTKPPYFIENQTIGEDRHFSLAPSMSALIITSHVKEGIELAKKYKLPQRIIDIIPEHQGTKLITYFYNKAKEAEKRSLQVVDERHYRYLGPRPQTREAGVILLADTVEAATRALKDRSATRLEEVVRNMINKNFIDGQLDECDLTLKDLEVIGRSFVRILVGIYHQRIEYPEIPVKESPLSIVPSHVDKYTQPSPLNENSFREDQKGRS